MMYFIQLNRERNRVEIVVTNHKGNEETRIHGDDTLFFSDGKSVAPANAILDILAGVELKTNEPIIEYEGSSRNNAGVSA